ncbi:MAG: hypothetical protein GY896_22895 [Gammaproteobacteria bacterium]|nr:hypothetical protein [Gammaproteobacteria bacterium]
MLRNNCEGSSVLARLMKLDVRRAAFKAFQKLFCDHDYDLIGNGKIVHLDPEKHGTIEMKKWGRVARMQVAELHCRLCKKTVAMMKDNHIEIGAALYMISDE